MTIMERIELNPKVCNGKPVIKGTRIPISVILEQIAQGESWDDLLKGYPELKKDDIKAALLYVRASLDHTEVSGKDKGGQATVNDNLEKELEMRWIDRP